MHFTTEVSSFSPHGLWYIPVKEGLCKKPCPEKRCVHYYQHVLYSCSYISIIEDTEKKQIVFVGTMISKSKPSFECFYWMVLID